MNTRFCIGGDQVRALEEHLRETDLEKIDGKPFFCFGEFIVTYLLEKPDTVADLSARPRTYVMVEGPPGEMYRGIVTHIQDFVDEHQ